MPDLLFLLLGALIGAGLAALAARPERRRLAAELAAARSALAASEAAQDAAREEMAALGRESERRGQALSVDNAALRQRMDELANEILRRAT